MPHLARAGALGGAAVALCAACYTYEPVRTVAPTPGREVRATLAVPTSLRLGELTLHDVERVDGLVYAASGDSLLVSGAWVYTQFGSRYAANGGVFPFERPALRSLEVRRFSPRRTGVAALIAGGIAVALFSVVDRVLAGAGPSPPGGDGN